MQIVQGRIDSIRSDIADKVSLTLDCPDAVIPSPGKYLLADEVENADSVLPAALFRVGSASQAIFQSVDDLPKGWGPGTLLTLRGPLGKGFAIPADVRHLALASFGNTISRLLPLISENQDADIAIFTEATLPALPLAVEAHPLRFLSEAILWADFMALDIPLSKFGGLRAALNLDDHQSVPCHAQALIETAMPCGAVAECGVCAVPAKKGYKLACIDGPVFDLKQLKW